MDEAVGDLYVWRRKDHTGRYYYNVTKTGRPPRSDSGYYGREYVIEVKKSRLLANRNTGKKG